MKALIASWKRSYPSIEKDLQEAYSDIRKDVQACRCRQMGRFSEVLGGFILHKYRQRNSQAREGASGGWRIVALYDKAGGTLYPILVYPKKAWAEAADDLITNAIKEMMAILKPPIEGK